jgi:hypothetical protein
MPSGNICEYKIEYCEMLKDHFRDGGTFRSFAGVCEVSLQTLYNWLEKFPEFLDAKKKYEEASYLWWEKAGKKALFLPNEVKFQASVYNIYMNRIWGKVDVRDLDPDEYQNPHRLSVQELDIIIQTAEEAVSQLRAIRAERFGLIEYQKKGTLDVD